MEFFIATHTNKDGGLDEGAQKVVVSFTMINELSNGPLITLFVMSRMKVAVSLIIPFTLSRMI